MNKTWIQKYFSPVCFFSPMIDNYAKQRPEQKKRSNFTSQLHIIPMTFPEFLVNDPNFEMLERYKDIMVTTIKSLEDWKNDALINDDMTQVVENEWKLAQISRYEYYYDE